MAFHHSVRSLLNAEACRSFKNHPEGRLAPFRDLSMHAEQDTHNKDNICSMIRRAPGANILEAMSTFKIKDVKHIAAKAIESPISQVVVRLFQQV